MSPETLRELYRRWLPLALIVAAAANLVVNERMSTLSQPLLLRDSSSLTHLVHSEQSFLDGRYGMYMELADVMAGATLYVPVDSPVSPHLARGLSDVSVVERDYDAEVLHGDLVSEAQPPIGEFRAGERDLPFWILSDDDDSRWWLAHTSEGLVIAPASVSPVPEART